MRKALQALALTFAVALTACAAGASTLTEADDGQTVRLQVGDTFAIELPGNPSTGYSWNGSAEPEVVVLTGEPAFEADSDAIGAGGMITLTFEAVEAGEAELELQYSRAWESVQRLETFSVTVVVAD
jgi:inhibitor of cysteine peptidase